MKNQIDELTLLLLYLTSFPEDYGLGEARRSWKGYPFESLDELIDNNYIDGNRRTKSVYLTDEGIQKAQESMKKYKIENS
ncbi:transposase [Ralstonia pickettii]|nr:transposase [Ralstonia pickettii]